MKEKESRERKEKSNGEKMTFVEVEPTPFAIRADVLSQLVSKCMNTDANNIVLIILCNILAITL